MVSGTETIKKVFLQNPANMLQEQQNYEALELRHSSLNFQADDCPSRKDGDTNMFHPEPSYLGLRPS